MEMMGMACMKNRVTIMVSHIGEVNIAGHLIHMAIFTGVALRDAGD
tara:strand:+ start:238 stop:375 length:138 start_codon:yes stop_codon:yes gene_type:complete